MAPQLVLALSVTFEERMSKKKRILKAPILVILWCGTCGVLGFFWLVVFWLGFIFSTCKTVHLKGINSGFSLTVIFLSV